MVGSSGVANNRKVVSQSDYTSELHPVVSRLCLKYLRQKAMGDDALGNSNGADLLNHHFSAPTVGTKLLLLQSGVARLPPHPCSRLGPFTLLLSRKQWKLRSPRTPNVLWPTRSRPIFVTVYNRARGFQN